MRAKQIIVEGIHFRSKLEARWYLFFKKLGWNIIYEPEIEGLTGWLPDFLIIGKNGWKTLVDVKPIDSISDWEDYYEKPIFKDKGSYQKYVGSERILRGYHPDYHKIMNSGIKTLAPYELLILGSNLRLDGGNGFGILYERNVEYDRDENDVPIRKDLGDIHRAHECMFVENDRGQIGFFSHEQSWTCKITDNSGKLYMFRDQDQDAKFFKNIDTMWNASWSELRWKGKEIA